MSEKYYMVSEEELNELKMAATIDGYCYSDDTKEVDKALDACRVRPVPEWATHFAYEVHPRMYYSGIHLEEIKR